MNKKKKRSEKLELRTYVHAETNGFFSRVSETVARSSNTAVLRRFSDIRERTKRKRKKEKKNKKDTKNEKRSKKKKTKK